MESILYKYVWQILLGYFAFWVSVIIILLFGNTFMCRNTPIGWLYRFFTDAVPNFIGKICGNSVGGCCSSTFHYFLHKPNPILQTFYSILVLGLFYWFWLEAYPQLPAYHKIGSWFAVIMTYGSFIWACYADPGVITPRTLLNYNKVYELDGMLYGDKECETCKISRPARSKHCSVCDRCVARFDHHCGWINNCVGANNVRWFLLFLFNTGSLCVYCVLLCGMLMWRIVEENELLDAAKDPRFGWSYFVRVLIIEGGMLFSLSFFTVMLATMMFFFLSYHLYLVVRNTTTNETFKWKDAHAFQRDCQRTIADPKFTLRSGKRLEVTPAVQQWATRELKNIYNRGISNNFKEILFPDTKPLRSKPNTNSSKKKK